MIASDVFTARFSGTMGGGSECQQCRQVDTQYLLETDVTINWQESTVNVVYYCTCDLCGHQNIYDMELSIPVHFAVDFVRTVI